jgi:hypothetical protein
MDVNFPQHMVIIIGFDPSPSISIHRIDIDYSTLQHSRIHYTTLHYTTLHYITLHYITYMHACMHCTSYMCEFSFMTIMATGPTMAMAITALLATAVHRNFTLHSYGLCFFGL